MYHLPSAVIPTEVSQPKSKYALEKCNMGFRERVYPDFTGAYRIECFKTDGN